MDEIAPVDFEKVKKARPEHDYDPYIKDRPDRRLPSKEEHLKSLGDRCMETILVKKAIEAGQGEMFYGEDYA